ncbi:hypothetical protein [Rhizobium leguminosarum]|uniref:hypothetical protein n=1 Tax=Rhizobium leguminosarum TaxID=384 RepID=UPI001031607F|nr:hypothetical protein [Rhizobium leguminosarum]TAX29829.1 hypothetical protein ELI04_08680 [Rhizobium leguminosarum]
MEAQKLKEPFVAETHASTSTEVQMPPCYVDCRFSDNTWFAKLGVATRSYPAPAEINFAVPVSPFPNLKLLTDPEFHRDLLTVKLILVDCTKPKPRGWITSKEGLLNVFRSLLTFIRARLAMGIRQNSDLSPEAKRLYVARLKKGGHFNLIDFPKRTQAIVEAVNEGTLSVDMHESRGQVDMDFLALLYGVPTVHSVPPEEIDKLKSHLRAHGYAFRIDFRGARYAGKKRARVTKLGVSRAQELMKPWLWLWKYRDILDHDKISFRPFLDERDIEKAVRRWARKKGSTKEMSPHQVVDLLRKSLSFLTDPLTNFLIELAPRLSKRDILPDEREFVNGRLAALRMGRLAEDYLQKSDLLEGVSLRHLIFVFIPVAASCVIAMGTARRKDEIDSLLAGCVTTDDLGQHWLRVPVRKIANRSVGRDAHTSIIPIGSTVKLAIETLEKLKTASGNKSNYLFDIDDPVLGTKVGLKFSVRIREFSRWLTILPDDDGSEAQFAAHQFRKFFAITYFYRYRFPSLPALSLHLMHLNLDVTRAYLAATAKNSLKLLDESKARSRQKTVSGDVARMEDLEEVGRGFVFDVLLSATKGELKLAGGAATHLLRDLSKLTEKVSASIDIHTSAEEDRALNNLLKRFAGTKRLHPHPDGHGFCASDKTRNCLLAANCLKAKASATGQDIHSFGDVDHAFADDVTCATCVHHLLLPELWPYWEAEIDRCEAVFERARGEQKDFVKSRLESLREYELKIKWQWAA